MGYTHLTDIAQYIPPSMIGKSVGTWTAGVGSNLASEGKAAAGEAPVLTIPLFGFGSNGALLGARIKKVRYWYSVAVADLTNFNTVAVIKTTLNANAVACTGAAVANTVTAANDTSDKRKTQAAHMLEVTLTTPQFFKDSEALFLHLAFTAHTNSVYTHFGAYVFFDLRL